MSDTMDTKSELQILRESFAEAIEGIYKVGGIPRLFVNARLDGVVVPEHVRSRFGTRLVIDLRPEYPLNMVHSPVGLEVDLAFAGYTTRCVFLWRSIYSIIDLHTGQGIVIPSNVPEHAPEPEAAPAAAAPEAELVTNPRAKALGLRLVKGGQA
jgi:hypothetical protein